MSFSAIFSIDLCSTWSSDLNEHQPFVCILNVNKIYSRRKCNLQIQFCCFPGLLHIIDNRALRFYLFYNLTVFIRVQFAVEIKQ